MTAKAIQAWLDEMPILAAILRTGEPRCALHGTERGGVERESSFGTLYRCGDHYTLCTGEGS